jgi:hypothetical protein
MDLVAAQKTVKTIISDELRQLRDREIGGRPMVDSSGR